MTSIFEKLEEFTRLLWLINHSATGTPRDLAKRMGLSRRTVLRSIEEMKSRGLPVAYCRNRQTYYFTAPTKYAFTMTCGEDALLNIKGGCGQNFFKKKGPVSENGSGGAEFCHWKRFH